MRSGRRRTRRASKKRCRSSCPPRERLEKPADWSRFCLLKRMERKQMAHPTYLTNESKVAEFEARIARGGRSSRVTGCPTLIANNSSA